jgi:hypothetical protein
MMRCLLVLSPLFAGTLLLSTSVTYAEAPLVLDCKPDLSSAAHDRDPVASVAVSVNGFEWRVTHIVASGKRYERTEQYGLHDVSDHDAASRIWQGTLIKRPYLKMVGQIHSARDNFTYDESLYDTRKDGAKIIERKFTCLSAAARQPVTSPQPQTAQTLPQAGGPTGVPTDATNPSPKVTGQRENVDDPSVARIAITGASSNPPVITGTTNLPDGTHLSAFIRGDFPKCAPRCGFQYHAIPEHGQFRAVIDLPEAENSVPPDLYTVDIIVTIPPPFHPIPTWGSDNLAKYTSRILVEPRSSSLVQNSGRFVAAVDPEYDAEEIEHGHQRADDISPDVEKKLNTASLRLIIPEAVKRNLMNCISINASKFHVEDHPSVLQMKELLSECSDVPFAEYCNTSSHGDSCGLTLYKIAGEALEKYHK